MTPHHPLATFALAVVLGVPVAWSGDAPMAGAPVIATTRRVGTVAGPAVAEREREPNAAAIEAPVPALLAAPDAALLAGRRVAIGWRDPGPGVVELELVLSLDDGRTWPLRVSPQLDGRECRYEWVVPRVATHSARLRLRMRVHGHEIASDAGERFAIALPAGERAELRLVSDGAWWSGSTPALPERAAWRAFPGSDLRPHAPRRVAPMPSRHAPPRPTVSPLAGPDGMSACASPARVARGRFLPACRGPMRA